MHHLRILFVWYSLSKQILRWSVNLLPCISIYLLYLKKHRNETFIILTAFFCLEYFSQSSQKNALMKSFSPIWIPNLWILIHLKPNSFSIITIAKEMLVILASGNINFNAWFYKLMFKLLKIKKKRKRNILKLLWILLPKKKKVQISWQWI